MVMKSAFFGFSDSNVLYGAFPLLLIFLASTIYQTSRLVNEVLEFLLWQGFQFASLFLGFIFSPGADTLVDNTYRD